MLELWYIFTGCHWPIFVSRIADCKFFMKFILLSCMKPWQSLTISSWVALSWGCIYACIQTIYGPRQSDIALVPFDAVLIPAKPCWVTGLSATLICELRAAEYNKCYKCVCVCVCVCACVCVCVCECEHACMHVILLVHQVTTWQSYLPVKLLPLILVLLLFQ